MSGKAIRGIIATNFHVFPGIILPKSVEKLTRVEVKNKDQLVNEQPKNKEILERCFSMFTDPYGNCIESGSYIADEINSVVEEVWSLLRYAAFIPKKVDDLYISIRSPDIIDWYSFYTPQYEQDLHKNYDIFSIYKNGNEIWKQLNRTSIYPFIQRLHLLGDELKISDAGLKTSQRVSVLFSRDGEYDTETIKLAARIRKAIYWYNKSFELKLFEKNLRLTHSWDLESQLLYMAIAFETLFQPSKIEIQKHLETSLKVIFPDNEFVPKWLTQFYTARSTIAHGSSINDNDIEFKPDKYGHNSLIYWSRKIFRVCIDAIVSQWEIANRTGLLKEMTPNRIRLNRIYSKTSSLLETTQIISIPEDIRVDIRDLHASWIDTPDEAFLFQTSNVGNILANIAINSQEIILIDLKKLFAELLNLPKDWYKEPDIREQACEIYLDILALFGDDANIMEPLVDLSTASLIEQTLYHWARFAYAHIWSVDI